MTTTNPDSQDQAICKDFLLIALRKAALRAELDKNEILSIGCALNHDWITVEHAIEWLFDVGLLDQIDEVRP